MEEEKGEVEGVVVDNGVVVWNKELPPKVSVIRDSKAFLPVSGAGVVGDDRRDEPAKREELENKPLPNKLPRPPESEDFLVSSSFFFHIFHNFINLSVKVFLIFGFWLWFFSTNGERWSVRSGGE